MKFSIFSVLSLGALAHAIPTPHTGHKSTTAAAAVPSSLIPSSHVFDPTDETPGTGGDWTVILDNDDPRDLDDMLAEMNLTVSDLKYAYNNTAFKGFSASLSGHCLHRLSNMTGWKTYALDTEVHLHATKLGTWGLKRLSQDAPVVLPQGQSPTSFAIDTYAFEGATNSLGAGVDIYVVDTGVNVDHIDFGGRATFGYAFDGDETDKVGHGTHCAGTAASRTFGVAKAANVIAVKVLGGADPLNPGGRQSDVIDGINFVVQQHESRKLLPGFKGSVISMSLGSNDTQTALLESVRAATEAGIHVSVAAGNDDVDACGTTPAAASVLDNGSVISVGATTITDERASFSNFGKCVTVYAPGTQVVSTFVGPNNDEIQILQGTSMACPHVTGLIAYNLALNSDLKTDTAAMKELIVSSANKINTGIRGDPSIIINNGISAQ